MISQSVHIVNGRFLSKSSASIVLLSPHSIKSLTLTLSLALSIDSLHDWVHNRVEFLGFFFELV